MKIFFIIAVILWYIITTIVLDYSSKKNWKIFIVLMIFFILTTWLFTSLGVFMGNIETLKGNPTYKMEIKYELKDSIFVPSDTIYVLK